MMTIKMQIIIIIALCFGFFVVANMVRRKNLELKYALSWLVVIVALLIITIVPGLLDWMAHVLGIYSAVNMVFFLGFCFLIILVFSLTVALSRSSRRIRHLAQQSALNEKKLNDIIGKENQNV